MTILFHPRYMRVARSLFCGELKLLRRSIDLWQNRYRKHTDASLQGAFVSPAAGAYYHWAETFCREVVMSGAKDLTHIIRKAKPLTSEEASNILKRDRFQCQYCGLDGMADFENSLIMTVDFVIPRAKKGKNDPRNLVAACRPCNVIKGERVFKTMEEAKQYIHTRREELRSEWEASRATLRGKSRTA